MMIKLYHRIVTLIILSSCLLLACGDDDDDNNIPDGVDPDACYIGTWRFSQNTTFNGAAVLEVFDLQIRPDGTMFFAQNFTPALNTCANPTVSGEATFSVDGNEFTISLAQFATCGSALTPFSSTRVSTYTCQGNNLSLELLGLRYEWTRQ